MIDTVLSDNGREFCGRPDQHPYELFLQLEDIEHRTTRVEPAAVQRHRRAAAPHAARRALPRPGPHPGSRPSTRCRPHSMPFSCAATASGRLRLQAFSDGLAVGPEPQQEIRLCPSSPEPNHSAKSGHGQIYSVTVQPAPFSLSY